MADDFWFRFWEIKRIIRTAQHALEEHPQAAYLQAVTRYLEDYCWDLLVRDLGVHWGAFGVANGDTDRFTLLASDANTNILPGDYDGPAVFLPYLRTNQQGARGEKQELLQFMFHQRRSTQPLLGGGENGLGPEFYTHLPRHHADALPYAPRLPLPPVEMWSRTYLGCHYCGLGEISFFLYAWRMLLRCIQLWGHEGQFIPGGLTVFHTSPSVVSLDLSFWDEGFWPTELGYQLSSPELTWSRSLSMLDDQLAADQLDPTLAHTIREQWQQVRSELDRDQESPHTGYTGDWEHLSIILSTGEGSSEIVSARAGIALRPMLRYAQGLLTYLRDNAPEDVELRSLQRSLQELTRLLFPSAQPLMVTSLRQFDTILQRIVYSLLCSSCARPCLSEFVAALHRVTRFPIIPYFYWGAVDRTPKAHLVIPVWDSGAFKVRVRVPAANGKTEPCSTPTVGVCLMGVEPIKGLDWTLTGRKSSPRNVPDRINHLMVLCSELMKPVIDYGFYGSIIRRRLEITASSLVSHEAVGLIEEIQRDPGAPSARVFLWHVRALMSLWSKRPLPAATRVTDGLDSPFESWTNLSTRLIVDRLIDYSLTQSVYRATMREAGDSEDFGDFLIDKSREMRTNSDTLPGRSLRTLLGLSDLPDIVPDWMAEFGFVISFHHCLWQAGYHGFRAWCSDHLTADPVLFREGDRTEYLSIMSVDNRVTISNRYVPKVGVTWQSSRDGDFYRRIKERLENRYHILGPDKNGDVYETSILHMCCP